jgi:hypothetical protein
MNEPLRALDGVDDMNVMWMMMMMFKCFQSSQKVLFRNKERKTTNDFVSDAKTIFIY